MSRLIDANALKDRFKLRLDWLKLDVHDDYTKGLYHGCDYDMTLIDEQPTMDAVEVVRCKDCKHMKIDRNGYRWCLVWTGINSMGDEGFCNYGERKDNES